MHAVIFTSAARAEITDAQDWYQNEVPGLGRSFRAAADDVVQRMIDTPYQFPAIYKGIRRALFHRFPYALMFVVGDAGTLTVLACFHGSRNPKQWQRRV